MVRRFHSFQGELKYYFDCFSSVLIQFILKSCENTIVCWKPGRLKAMGTQVMNNNSVAVIHRFEYRECDIWFMRFCLDSCNKVNLLKIKNRISHINLCRLSLSLEGDGPWKSSWQNICLGSWFRWSSDVSSFSSYPPEMCHGHSSNSVKSKWKCFTVCLRWCYGLALGPCFLIPIWW